MRGVDKLVETLHPLERKVLPFLRDGISVSEVVSESGMVDVEVIRAFQWLGNKGVLKIKKQSRDIISLDVNGKNYLEKGLPERRFLEVLEEPLTMNEIKDKASLDKDELNICLGLLKKLDAINFGAKISLAADASKVVKEKLSEEEFLKSLPKEVDNLNEKDKRIYKELKKRRQIIQNKLEKTISVDLTEIGKKLVKSKIKDDFVDTLKEGMIKTGNWEGKKFRRYDVEINVPKIYGGRRHFVNEAIKHARRIWLDMGFKEMKGPIINSSFWNFDALFVPQDHPARELQDTFFLKGRGKLPDFKLLKRVKKEHEGSWKYKWSEEDAKKLVLRTHTTVLSAKTIAKLKESDLPVKYFAIGRNYRNEALDWSHLFEFNQTEGIVVDEGANLKQLMGYLREFAKKMGFHKIRFRPAYFPYTEPSLEGDVYDPVHKKWIELIAAGIFRPEVVKPLLGKDVPVLAWGPGLDRMIMSVYNLKDIRELYKNDLKQLKEMKVWV